MNFGLLQTFKPNLVDMKYKSTKALKLFDIKNFTIPTLTYAL